MGCTVSGHATASPGADLARRPRMRRGLVVLPLDDGLLIEGGPSRQVLTGSAASSLLPRLLPMLDGQRSSEEIRAQLSLSPRQFDRALSLLNQRALLEWVRPDRAAEFAAEHVATYLSRTLSLTEDHRSTDDLAEELASATVLIVAPPLLARPMAADLSETGVGTVTILESGALASTRVKATGRCVAAVFDDSVNQEAFGEVIEACRERDVPVLRFAGTADAAEIGPIFFGIETACVSCFRRSRGSAGEKPGEPAPDGLSPREPHTAGGGTAGREVTGMLPGLVVSALLAILLGQYASSPWRLARTSLPSMLTDLYDVIPDLECGYCAGGAAPEDATSQACLAYEWRMGKWPVFLTAGRATSPAEAHRLAALRREREDLPSSPRHRLPDQHHVPAPGAAGHSRRLDESVLAGMLVRTAGFRPTAGSPDAQASSSRWMASGGNLASVSLYLITESDMFGLPGTVSRYDDVEHQIVSVHADHIPLAQVLAGTGLDAAYTDLVIVLTAAVGRLGKKYHDFAWRLAHLDAGCAAIQLRTIAGGYGVQATFAAAWPAQLGQTLELDPRREIVTAVAGISALGHLPAEGPSRCQ
jgi:SagB-type dehydrogenase family enzyme